MELQKPELKGLKTGEENKFIKALESKKIKDCSHEEIKEVLRYVMIKIGLREKNLPNDIEKLVLIEHIVQEFGGHHLQEIRLAFDLAIARKIEAEVNCYENFSCLYFSNIMFAYRKWSSGTYELNQREIEKPQQKQLEYATNPKQDIQELVELMIADYKADRLKLEYVLPSLYDKLVLHGFVEEKGITKMEEKRFFVFNYIMNKAKND